MYPQTMAAMSRLSFMKPASKSGASYGSADVMCVEPREKGYSCGLFSYRIEGEEVVWSWIAYQEVEHGEELARGHEHVVSEEAVSC